MERRGGRAAADAAAGGGRWEWRGGVTRRLRERSGGEEEVRRDRGVSDPREAVVVVGVERRFDAVCTSIRCKSPERWCRSSETSAKRGFVRGSGARTKRSMRSRGCLWWTSTDTSAMEIARRAAAW